MEKKIFDIGERSLNFGIEVIKASRLIKRDYASVIVINQFIRSGTSIGANIAEAQDAGTKSDFVYRIGISLREAKETRYWSRIMIESEMLASDSLSVFLQELDEIIKILTTILKNSKQKK